MRHPTPIITLLCVAGGLTFGCEPETPRPSGEAVLSASELGQGGANNAPMGMNGSQDAPPGDLQPGVPEEPEPGIPDQPPPPNGGDPAAVAGAPPGPPPPSGPTVMVKGEVRYDDYAGGPIQIDVVDGPSKGPTGAQPKVIQLERLEKPGPFAIRISATAGDIYLQAFNDADENGRPDREDPQGQYPDNPVEVEGEDVEGVILTLSIEEVPPPPSGF